MMRTMGKMIRRLAVASVHHEVLRLLPVSILVVIVVLGMVVAVVAGRQEVGRQEGVRQSA